jgi:DNA-binding CsgD family transcriptional regulator
MYDYATTHDRSGALDRPYRMPQGWTRGDCAPGAEARAAGLVSCPWVNCPYSLVGHEMRRPADRAADLLVSRWQGERPDTCALDMADRGVTDQELGRALDISGERVAQVAAEATHRLRRALRWDTQASTMREHAAQRQSREEVEGVSIRAMVQRCSGSDLTDEELAEELGCNVDTVRQYRCR